MVVQDTTDKIRIEVPDVSGGMGDTITMVEGAIVVPPPKDNVNRSVQRSGVLTPDGRFVTDSITWRGTNQVTTAPPMPAADEIAALPGTWMFLGPLFGHFGHFLVESISRIWAFEQLRDRIDGVLYVPKFQNRPAQVASSYRPFLEALGVTAPVRNLEDATRVERLYVPRQGFGMFQMIEGAPEFRAFTRAHAGKSIPPRGAEKIYISRSALPAQRGSILGETILEELLRDEGYEPFHPQQHTHEEQIAAYRAARQVVAVDCSPLHLLALVGDEEQNVGIIARRAGDLDEIFARQIRAFTGARAHAINHLRRNWIEGHANRPSRTSWGEVDFPALGRSLREAGLIAGGNWPALDEAAIRAQMARVGETLGTGFRPWEEGG